MVLAAVNFIFWGGYSLVSLIMGRWIHPRVTKKTKLFFLAAFLGLVLLKIIGYFFFSFHLPAVILSVVVFFPIIVLIAFRAMEVPVGFVKRRLISKASNYRQKIDKLMVIGVTGSYGKTSVKDFLYHFLSCKYGTDKVIKTPDNNNTEMGVVKTILNQLRPDHLFFVCEAGAYCRNEIKRVAALIQPRVGILTGLNAQHLSLFGSIENIVRAEYELIESLPKDGLSIFNGDNAKCRELYLGTKPKKIIVGTSGPDLDWRIEEVKVGQKNISFRLVGQKTLELKANLVGRQNAINIALAASAAMSLGVSSQEIIKFASTLSTPFGGAKLLKHKKATVINTTYSSNPDGAIAHIDHLNLWSGKKAIISFGFIELGEETERAYYKIGQSIGRNCDLAIFTRNHCLDQVKKGVVSVKGRAKIRFLPKSGQTIQAIQEFKGPNDVILLEGRIHREIIDYFHD